MFKHTLVLLSIVLAITSLFAVVEESASFRGFMYGEASDCAYDDWISHITKGIARPGYNVYAPFYRQSSFGAFYAPSEGDISAWGEICELFIAGDFEGAEAMIDFFEFPYDIVKFNDTDTGRTFYMLRERLNMGYFDDQGTEDTADDVHGGFDYAWGLFVMYPESEQPIIVNVPHPGDDFIATPLAVQAFLEWEARYLMIAASGREVLWSGQGNFTNDSSLSDPSRVEVHPFNDFYKQACLEIRETFGRVEYSAQLHSFDWNSNTHAGTSSAQISAGPAMNYPGLPIRDFSSRKLDFINQTNYIIHPANTIGIHNEVTISNYYAVFYDSSLQPFYYDNGEMRVPVNNRITLPGAATNVQFHYTNGSRSKYDVLSTFLHIEFDELPITYRHDELTYKWFYGFDVNTNTFDIRNRFENVLNYYGPMITNIKDALHQALALDDGMSPATVEDFIVSGNERTRVTLKWSAVDCYDFETYEITISNIANDPSPDVYDRNDFPVLASAKTETVRIGIVPNGETYYVKLRAKDYNGNYSAWTAQESFVNGLADIANYTSRALDTSTFLSWTALNQDPEMLGYRIYRSENGGARIVVADWNSHPNLARLDENQSFSYEDDTMTYYHNYIYQIVMVDRFDVEFNYHTPSVIPARPMYTLIFENADDPSQGSDRVVIGYSPLTSDGVDNWYDVARSGNPSHQINAYQPNWTQGNVQGVRLSREFKGDFDPINDIKIWQIRLRSDQRNTRVRLERNSNSRHSTKLIFTNGFEYANLFDTDFIFREETGGFIDCYLYVGNVQPRLNFGYIGNQMFRAGDRLQIPLYITFVDLMESYATYLISDTDSLFIGVSTDTSDLNVNFTIPDHITMHNMALVVEMTCTDGEILKYQSDWRIGIVPTTTTLNYHAGYNFVSNPFITNNLTLADLNANGELYSFTNLSEAYWDSSIETMRFGEGYLLNLPEATTVSFDHNIQKQVSSAELQPGWNLVANPHLRDLHIKDIDFAMAGAWYSYAQLFHFNILPPFVRVLRNGIYQNSEFVLAGEAFMIYVNIPDGTLEACFELYKNNPNFYPNIRLDWQAKLTVASPSNPTLSDEIYVSVSADSDMEHYRMLHRQPEPVSLPNNISMYLQSSDIAGEKFNTWSIGHLSTSVPESVELPLVIELATLAPVRFSFENIIDDFGYEMVLIIDGIEYLLDGTSEIDFTPETLVTNATIKIINDNTIIPDTDKVFTPLALTAYPNPFNPSTTIQFTVGTINHSPVQIDIYNIKGQKVKSLVNDLYSPGTHSVVWNGVDNSGKAVTSGIYFISVKTDKQYMTIKKVTLLK